MSGGKARYFITVILLLLVLAACSPLGSVFDSNGSFTANEMWIVPRRHEYRAGEYFLPRNDLYVYVSNEEGTVKSVPISQVSIGIVSNPNSATPNAPIPVPTSGAQLVNGIGTGRKLVVVEYSDFEPATYSIEVRAVIEDGGGSGQGSGFRIRWE